MMTETDDDLCEFGTHELPREELSRATSSTSTSSSSSSQPTLELESDYNVFTQEYTAEGEVRTLHEYWTPDGRCPTNDEMHMLIEMADDPKKMVRRQITAQRPANIQFPFDSPEARTRLRVLLINYRRLVSRVCHGVFRALNKNTDRVEFTDLHTEEIEMVRGVALMAGIETYTRCTPLSTTCAHYTTNIEVALNYVCGCRNVPIELQRSTAIYMGKLPPRVEKDSREETILFSELACKSFASARMLYYREVQVDGVVLIMERKTPRSPHANSPTPPLLPRPPSDLALNAKK
jgi:hypothetical protein